MKKNKNENKKLDIVRWVLLLPAVCLVWVLVMFLCAWIESFFYSQYLWESYGIMFMILDIFVIPGIAMFFTAKFLAPKYKIIAGLVTVFLCALWCQYFIWALSNTY